jgi:hypothetical protein
MTSGLVSRSAYTRFQQSIYAVFDQTNTRIGVAQRTGNVTA